MKVLILGASGQIGRVIYRKFWESLGKENVVATSRLGARLGMQDQDGLLKFNPFTGDWSMLGKVDLLINAIGQIRETNEMPFEKVHLDLTKLILQHRSQLGKPQILQISALGAGTQPDISFLSTKAAADHLLLSEKNSFVIRPSIICTPHAVLLERFRLILKIAKASLGHLILPTDMLSTKIQPIMSQDLAELVFTLAQKKTTMRIIEATGPEQLSFRQILNLGGEAQGMKLHFHQIPRPIVDPSVRFFVAPMLPGILTYGQFQLLFRNNISTRNDFQKVLGHKPGSSLDFWKTGLGK